MSDPLLDTLRRDLRLAEARAARDPSDLRHMNPGRLQRGAFQQQQAAAEARKLRQEIAIGEELNAQGISWTTTRLGVMLLLGDGSTYPANADRLAEQIGVLRQPLSPAEVREALIRLDLNPHASRELGWIRDRLQGVSAPKFRKGFLTGAGLLTESEGELQLTPLAREIDLLRGHEGEFGPWFTATALGTAWIYRCYLAGHVPLVKAARQVPVPQFELEIIAEVYAEQLDALPDSLRWTCRTE